MKIANIQVIERSSPESRKFFEVQPNNSVKFRRREWNKARTEHKNPTRVYVWPKGEALLDNIMERHNRPYELYRPLVEAELRNAGYSGRVRWSRRAGCSCGCSPAFVLDGQLDYVDPVDVHIDVE